MKTIKPGFLTLNEKRHLIADKHDRGNNYKIRKKAIESIRDLVFLCKNASSKQLHKIFSSFVTPTIQNQEFINGDFSIILRTMLEVCFIEGKKMIERELILDRIHRDRLDGQFQLISSAGWDRILEFSEEHIDYTEEIDNTLLIFSTQVLNPIMRFLEYNEIGFNYDFFPIIELE